VHDNRIGIAADVARACSSRSSTKEQGMGLGLGLAISADIARDLGGSLRASESRVLGGAMFVLRLKAHAALEPLHA
jgi:two-component system C4-dicarboxylate transport sensor histidine kinase DctB